MKVYMYGSYQWGETTGGLWAITDGHNSEYLVGNEDGSKIIAAYKNEGLTEYAYGSFLGRDINREVKRIASRCKEKYCGPAFTSVGVVKRYFTPETKQRGKTNANAQQLTFTYDKLNDQFCGIEATLQNGNKLFLAVSPHFDMPNIEYVKLQTAIQAATENETTTNEDNDIAVRSLEEIALTGKDITWVKNKRYYVVTEEKDAEQLISTLEQWKGLVVLDYETTGLRINRFGEVGSPAKEKIDKINAENKAANKPQYRVDKLVGLIFCVEDDTGYYLPIANRKFKNLYDNINDPLTRQTAERIKSDYTVGRYRNDNSHTARYVRNTPVEQFTCDVILMLRCRWLMENKPMGAHHGSFEYKCTLLYGIDLNLTDDSMILHQLLFKFKNAKSSRGNRSDLKTLTKQEFGVDQLSLEDFFVGFKEEEDTGFSSGAGKSKRKKVYIDFSYMDYAGTKAYGPADGDFTYQLIKKYKKYLMENSDSRLQYLYNVEMVVACAIGYMEFHGHRIDENKIKQAEVDTIAEQLDLEGQIRDIINYNTEAEKTAFAQLAESRKKSGELADQFHDGKMTKQAYDEWLTEYRTQLDKIRTMLDESENFLNLNAPVQVAMMLYDKAGLPLPDDGKRTVQKRAVKPHAKAKDKDGKLKYPIADLYLKWKNSSTLLSKFFGALQDFMYPDGFIFSQFGQITTATGRMSCSKPNAQQYPKLVTKMVIPRDNCVFVDADYSQIEYRTMVALSQEKKLLEEFKDPDMDYHTTMASLMFGVPYAEVTSSMRSDAKTFNFGIPYGMGIKKLAFQLVGREDKEAVEEAKEKRILYFKDQPKVEEMFERIKEYARDHKYTETHWGRQRSYNFEDKDGNIDDRLLNGSLRQAGNAVIQGTAADIYKIGVARFFSFIRSNHLLSKVYITNMIHDEQLVEINYKECNVKAILAHLIECMQLHLEGFPPLYVGAGVGKSWAVAKSKDAEIHPLLGVQYMHEGLDLDLKAPEGSENFTLDSVVSEYDQANYKFREQKVLNYLLDSKNYGMAIHPVIAALIKLQFDYGVKKEIETAAKLAKESGHPWSKEQEAKAEEDGDTERLVRFMKAHNVNLPIEYFQPAKTEVEAEPDDTEYDDDEENGFETDNYGDVDSQDFKIIEENAMFGVQIADIIKEFKCVVAPQQKVCGIYTNGLPKSVISEVTNYLAVHYAEEGTPKSMEVCFVRDGDLLYRTGVYVTGVRTSELEAMMKPKVKKDKISKERKAEIQTAKLNEIVKEHNLTLEMSGGGQH